MNLGLFKNALTFDPRPHLTWYAWYIFHTNWIESYVLYTGDNPAEYAPK